MTPPVRPEPDDPLARYRAQRAASTGAPPAPAKPDTSADPLTTFRAKHALVAGEEVDPNEDETYGDRIAGGLSAAYQGLTFGAGNKITAGIRTVLPEWAGGVKGFDYKTALKEQTDVLDDYRTRHPTRSAALEMISGLPSVLATGGGGALGETANLSRFGRMASLMGEGAAYGGGTAAMEAVRPGATAEDVGKSGAVGAVAGAVAAPIVSAVAAPVVRGLTRTAARFAPAGAADRIAALAGGEPVTPRGEAKAALRGALEQGGVDINAAAKSAGAAPEAAIRSFPASKQTVEEYAKAKGIPYDQAVAKMRAAGYQLADDVAPVEVTRESPTSMMELGSRSVPSLVRAARNVPTSTAAQETDRFLAERAAGTGKRIESALNDATGHDATDTWLPVEKMIGQRAAEARPLYEQAYAHGPIQDPETLGQIATLRKNPVFSRAWRRGQALGALERGEPETELGSQISPDRLRELQDQGLDKFLPKQVTTGPSVQDIDSWKKGLDAIIESSYGSENALSRSEARVYRQKLNDVLDRVDQEVPAYKAARASFRGHSELMDAAEAGAEHFSPKTPTGALERQLNELSPSEQEAYRSNALNSLVAKIRQAAANPNLPEAGRANNIVQKIMGTEDAGERLGMLFPDEKSFETFLGQMEGEALYPKTNQFLRGQSSTAAQLQEGAVSPSAWRDLALAPFSRMAKFRLATRAAEGALGREKLPTKTADEIGHMATATGYRLRQILSEMQGDKAAREAGRLRLRALTAGATAEAGGEQKLLPSGKKP